MSRVVQVLVVTPDALPRVFSRPDASAVRVGPDGVTLVGAAGDVWPEPRFAHDGDEPDRDGGGSGKLEEAARAEQRGLALWQVEDARGGEPTTAVAVLGTNGRALRGVLGRFDAEEVAEAARHGGLRHSRRTEPPRATGRTAASEHAWAGPRPYGFPFPVMTTAAGVRGGRITVAVLVVVAAFAAYPVLALLAGWEFAGWRSGLAVLGTFVVLAAVGLRLLVVAFRALDRAGTGGRA